MGRNIHTAYVWTREHKHIERLPVVGLERAAAAPVWTGTQTPAAAVSGHSLSRSLRGKPPKRNSHHFIVFKKVCIFRHL